MRGRTATSRTTGRCGRTPFTKAPVSTGAFVWDHRLMADDADVVFTLTADAWVTQAPPAPADDEQQDEDEA